MKIYFAGSIRGGRDDQGLYALIIEILQQYGTVLTEHVSNKAISSYGETHMSNNEIYERDTAWEREADIVIAEVTTPSLGVGYEVAYAEALEKPIICLYRPTEGKRLSAMLSGNSRLKVIEYQEVSDLKPVFESIFKNLAQMA